MLGVKFSCKDRWRQIPSEAERIKQKHLLTFEAGISLAQLEEMKTSNVQLVTPRGFFKSYKPEQQKLIIDFSSFIELVLQKQC